MTKNTAGHTQQTALQDKPVAAGKKAALRMGVSAAVVAGGAVWCMASGSEWAVVVMPFLGAVAVAFTWQVLNALCFARNPGRYHKRYTRPLYYALLVPLWSVYTFALFALPANDSRWHEPLVDALLTLLVVLGLFVLPLASIGFGVLAVAFGIQHSKNAPCGETKLYRRGPLAAALVLSLLTAGLWALGALALL